MSATHSHPDHGRLEGALLRYRDLLVLRWLCDQYAARLDHLEILTGRRSATVETLVRSLREMGFVRTWSIMVGEPTWVIPTRKGLRWWGLLYGELTPRSTHLPHIAAINDVRLCIQKSTPETLWVSRRQLMRGHQKGVCVPHGLAILEGHMTAIEVQLEAEPVGVMRTRLNRLERHFDAVVCFCGQRPQRKLARMKEKGQAPKLEVRKLPNPNGGPAERRI